MPFLNHHAIVTKVYDLLRFDTRTITIDWFNGRRAPGEFALPGGNVYLGSGTILPDTMPAGEVGRMRVIVEVFTARHEGAGRAEQAMREYLDAIIQVLVDNWDLGLTYAYPVGLGWDTSLDIEATPPYAIARCLLDVEVRP